MAIEIEADYLEPLGSVMKSTISTWTIAIEHIVEGVTMGDLALPGMTDVVAWIYYNVLFSQPTGSRQLSFSIERRFVPVAPLVEMIQWQ